jgi:hypothetical protein
VSNSIAYLNAGYVGTIRGNKLQAALRHTFELKCEYTGDGTGEFIGWFKNNGTEDVSVNTDKPGHYIVKNTDKVSTLLIKIFGRENKKTFNKIIKSLFFLSKC